jgi:beta-xylosidase
MNFFPSFTKSILSASAFVLICGHTIAQQKTAYSGNPVIQGWNADPEAKIFEGKYWIYPTYSAPYEQQVHMDAWSSTDLVHWAKYADIIDTAAIKWAKKAMWAPAVTEMGGKYYFFFGANDIHDDKKEIGGIGIGVSDKPQGPFKDYLGKPLIGKIYNGAQPIDQFIFKDNKDGQYYIIYGGWQHCNIAKLNKDFTGFIPFDDGVTFKSITPENYVEGPVMFTRKGKYYFMWSEGSWGGPDYRVAYAISNAPTGPFKRIGVVLQQDPKIATGAGHHSVIQIPGTDEWYIVYHRRPLTETDANHRVTCIDHMYFDENGLIKPIHITNEGVAAVALK